MKRTIPQVNLDELEAIWQVDRRLPTLQSRRKWSQARNLDPQALHRWYSRKRCQARRKHEDLPPDSDLYDLEIGVPPKPAVRIKTEAEPVISLRPNRKPPKWPASGLRRSRRIQDFSDIIDIDIPSSPVSLQSFFACPTSSAFTTPAPDEKLSCSDAPPVPSAVPTPRATSPIRVDSPKIPEHCGLTLSSTYGRHADSRDQDQLALECNGRSSDFTCVLSSDSELPSKPYHINEASCLHSYYPPYFPASTSCHSDPVLFSRPPMPITDETVLDSYGLSAVPFDSHSPDLKSSSSFYRFELDGFYFTPDGFHLCSSRCVPKCMYFSTLCDIAPSFPSALEKIEDVQAPQPPSRPVTTSSIATDNERATYVVKVKLEASETVYPSAAFGTRIPFAYTIR
ncbi:hypothetical protein V5O48_007352 [Marasmius crinis-equi]|uniref:Homeobox domain-containing protein n=1 Tax=Marasmius crinis-equi TaxID=585013 RepID=A0ABR3FHC7_9AGAR